MWLTHLLSRSTMPSGPLVASLQANFSQQLCMLIPLVWFAGQNSGAGTAVAAWERRTWGGAVQAKHSLALVSGWHSATHCCHRTWAMRVTVNALNASVLTALPFVWARGNLEDPIGLFTYSLDTFVCVRECIPIPRGLWRIFSSIPCREQNLLKVMSHIHSIVLTCNLCTSSYI